MRDVFSCFSLDCFLASTLSIIFLCILYTSVAFALRVLYILFLVLSEDINVKNLTSLSRNPLRALISAVFFFIYCMSL